MIPDGCPVWTRRAGSGIVGHDPHNSRVMSGMLEPASPVSLFGRPLTEFVAAAVVGSLRSSSLKADCPFGVSDCCLGPLPVARRVKFGESSTDNLTVLSSEAVKTAWVSAAQVVACGSRAALRSI